MCAHKAAYQADAESPQVDECQDCEPQNQLLRLWGSDIALPQCLSMSPHGMWTQLLLHSCSKRSRSPFIRSWKYLRVTKDQSVKMQDCQCSWSYVLSAVQLCDLPVAAMCLQLPCSRLMSSEEIQRTKIKDCGAADTVAVVCCLSCFLLR